MSELTFDEKLDRYAYTIVHTGLNIQPEQELYVSADVTQAPLARLVVRHAYEAGAKNVVVQFGDEGVGRLHYDYKPAEAFLEFPEWRALLQNGMAKKGAAFLFISSEDPEAMKGIDQQKLVNAIRASNEACKDWRDGMDFGRNVWCIVGAASPAWAQRVFPDLDEDEATKKLWQAILHTARCDTDEPDAAWSAHKADLEARRAWMNEMHFEKLHYTASNGTDIWVELPADHVWQGGGATTQSGTFFFPNMPTEEVFTSPDYRKTSGRVVASLPLNHAGSLVDGFEMTFEDGVVTAYSARIGEDVLKGIFDTDEGARRLGEIALVPKTSPIKQTGILFLNTLFDENAACHFAVGMGFPDCYEGGTEMSKDELLAAGVNNSSTHVDFMIGTDDLHIEGVRHDGEVVTIFDNGTWA